MVRTKKLASVSQESKNCKFCEALESYREIYTAGNSSLADPELGPYMHEYTAALVIRSWFRARGKRSAGRSTDYRHQGLGYQLNYCPECGRSLKKTTEDMMQEIKWNYVEKDGNPKEAGIYLVIIIYPEHFYGTDTGRKIAEVGTREFADAKKYGSVWRMDDQPETGLVWMEETGSVSGEYVYAWAPVELTKDMLPEGVEIAE